MLARIAIRTALIVVAVLAGTSARAQDMDRIAAVVNDEIITIIEVDQRIRMAMALSNLSDSQDARRRIVPQVLRKMIDERLQMQEANRLKISMNASEVENGLAAIEQQNRQPRGSLIANLGKIGIDPGVVRDQVRADLTWMRVAARVLQPSIRIGEEEVRDRIETIKQRQGQPEYLAAEIFLPVETSNQEEEMRALGDRLIEQLRSGTPFPSLARQFSRAPTAANGGAMGWLAEDLVDEELFKVIKTLEQGQVSPVIRAGDGFHILALIDRRIAGAKADPLNASVTVSEIVLPVPPDGPPREALMARAAELTRGAKSCPELEAIGRKLGSPKVGMTGPIKVGELPPAIRATVAQAPVNRVVPPVSMPDGLVVMMVCSREESTTIQLPSPEQVRRMIEDERMDMLTRRYLRDLRRAAFVDIRL